MQNKASINCPAFSMQTISFSKPKSNGKNYRSISSPAVSLHDSISAPVQFVKSHVNNGGRPQKNSQSLSMIEFSVNSSFPKSKAPFQPLQPLDISLTSMGSDIEKDEVSISCISPPCAMPLPLTSSTSSFKYCNELNSYLVDNSDYLQVMNTLNNILSHYRSDIDFKVDYGQKRINGLVFVGNYGVYFTMYIWKEPQHKTRIEFRRTSGDALASAKFWSQIQGLYSQNIAKQTNIEYNSFDFISLDAGLDTAHIKRFGKSELDELTQCLIENDVFVVDELNYFYECMLKNNDIAHDILAHEALMKELVDSALLNKDVCVSRTALLILHQLAAVKEQRMLEDGVKLFENINSLLNHQRGFIRRHSIELLYRLTNDMESGVNMGEMCKKHMADNVKQYESTCSDDSVYKMIHKINEKLMMK